VRIATFTILAVSVIVGGCARGAYVTVANQSQTTLENVVAHGSGFDIAIGDIPPGAVHNLRIIPSGESALHLTFVAAEKSVETRSGGYFEGSGYCVDAIVTSALDLDVKSKLTPC
jgi:hypothetical protein